MLRRCFGGMVLAALVAGLAGAGARRWRTPPSAPSANPADSAEKGEGEAGPDPVRSIAITARLLQRSPRAPLSPGGLAGPLPFTVPELSDLDRLAREGEPWASLQRGLTLAVSERLGDACTEAARDPSVVDLHFQARTTERGLEVTAPRVTVREGAPLSETTTRCLEQMLATPLQIPAPPGTSPPLFEGDARSTLALGG
jgi:hypothetical protein